MKKNSENPDEIPEGAFFVARKIFNSELWLRKPSSWKVIWIYILGNVNHTARRGLDRGEGFFNFSEEIRDIGIDITADKIKKFLCFARRNSLLDTTRSTRGMIVKVLNYNKYQDLQNYRSTTNGTREAREKHERSTPINNNGNNEENSNNVKPINKFFNKNFSSEVNSLFDDFIKQEIEVKHDFNYSRLTKLIKKLKDIAPSEAEKIAVLKQAIDNVSYDFKSLTDKEKTDLDFINYIGKVQQSSG